MNQLFLHWEAQIVSAMYHHLGGNLKFVVQVLMHPMAKSTCPWEKDLGNDKLNDS